MQLAHVKELEKKYLLGTYSRYELLADRGTGAYLIDKSNKRYLDLLAGIAVNALGYNHPRIKQVLRKQIKKPLHVSNLMYHEYQGRLAQKLCEVSGLDRAFFTNSGTESIEGCLKFARAYARPKFRVLSLDQSFHGRTFGALSATGQKQYREQFEPLVPGFDCVNFDDVGDLERKLTEEVCAVLIETIQGEGGIRPISEQFYRAARELTKQRGAVLIMDEIQCGLGRTGRWFAFHSFAPLGNKDMAPDMIALELKISGKEIVKQLLAQGFILNCTHETVLRLLPPFIITEKQIDKFVRALRPILEAQHV